MEVVETLDIDFKLVLVGFASTVELFKPRPKVLKATVQKINFVFDR